MKNIYFVGLSIMLAAFVFIGFYKYYFKANNSVSSKQSNKLEAFTNQQQIANDFSGNYVTAEYAKRNEGYDWVSVSVVKLSDTLINISVRSRADKKKPTCTFDAQAVSISDSIYKSFVDKKDIFYIFKNNTLIISAEDSTDSSLLNFPCSGGGSLANTYSKINEPIDDKQIDKTIYNKTLSWQSMGYDVSSILENGYHQLLIQPFGFINNESIKVQLDGHIENAEIEDLDLDGFPEIIVYEAPSKENRIHNVIGFSPNNGKSFSRIDFPATLSYAKINRGYIGNDEFAIVENTFVQRFKIYNMQVDTISETGKTRQIQYKLVKGEATKQFVIDKVLEY